MIREVFLRQMIQEKALFVEILLLVLAAALLTNFTHLFSEGQIGEVSFYVIYLLLLTMLFKAFGEMSLELGELLERLGNFMNWPLSGLLFGCGGGRGHCGKRHVLSAGAVCDHSGAGSSGGGGASGN